MRDTETEAYFNQVLNDMRNAYTERKYKVYTSRKNISRLDKIIYNMSKPKTVNLYKHFIK